MPHTYTIETIAREDGDTDYIVRENGEWISSHLTRARAAAAIARYLAADRRRDEWTREANRIDGYDRDDLGDSPDF